VAANVKKRPLEEGEVHGFSLNRPEPSATAKRRLPTEASNSKHQTPNTFQELNPKARAI
jgi:hypothetical protein